MTQRELHRGIREGEDGKDAAGFVLALVAGARGLASRKTRPFQAIAPVVAMGIIWRWGILPLQYWWTRA